MKISTDTLFGKYEICRILGRGRSGTVYLARHIELDEYRAIKEVPRSAADYQQFRGEALILKSIRHPGIPIVYDLEETSDHFYMIEEWMEGVSLYQMISDLGHLSAAATVSYGIQICHLVNFLHSAKPNPILYLDLHPRNLMVCRNTVKLIDFDHAVHLDEAGQLTRRYGAVGFAAPEQYTGDVLDERTDIYAIGAVLYYMLTGEFPDRHPVFPGPQTGLLILKILKKCLRKEPSQRYASVTELSDSLEHLQKHWKKYGQSERAEKKMSSLSIAVAGAFPGAGATHIAIGLTVWLHRHGLAALYEEMNDSGAVQQYAEYTKSSMDASGVCHIRGISMLPFYGPAVKLDKPEYLVHVCDLGVVGEDFLKYPADGYLLVCGSRPWEWKKTQSALPYAEKLQGSCILFNHCNDPEKSCLPAPEKGVKCFLMPCVSDPWAAGGPAEKVYEAMWRLWTGKGEEGFLKRWLGKWRK